MNDEIGTCVISLADPGTCCAGVCTLPPVHAVLDEDLVEHIRCAEHSTASDFMAVKPLVYRPGWKPEVLVLVRPPEDET